MTNEYDEESEDEGPPGLIDTDGEDEFDDPRFQHSEPPPSPTLWEAASDDDDGDDETPDLLDTDDEDEETNVKEFFASATASPDPPPIRLPEPRTPPKWRATVYISFGRTALPALADSGCTTSCISHDFFVRNPVFNETFAPQHTEGRAINGTEVPSVGEVKLNFWMEGTPMSIRCKVIKGLVEPVILGWDWMSKYNAILDAGKGTLAFEGGSTDLVENPYYVASCLYRTTEEVVLPPFSKVHLSVELQHNRDSFNNCTDTVITEPFSNNGATYWASRSCSKVKDNKFRTELINSTNDSIKIDAGSAIGTVEFINEEKFDAAVEVTEMFCSYSDIGPSQDTGPGQRDQADQPPQEEALEDSPETDNVEIPPGAKRLNVDYSQVAKDARKDIPRIKALVKKHSSAFSVHDRDYGKTDLIQYRANLKDPDLPPVSQKPFRTSPEMREVIDNQAHQMLADGLVGHSTSPFSAPILLAKKKCGGWRFLTDFRKINERCNKVVFPLPRIEDSIQRLEAPRYFSTMDLTKGFWQIPVHKEDRKFFAFSTESMHLEYLVAPMGAKNSPSCLSALMQLVLRGLPIQHVISYLDDILVADDNMEDHLKHLDQVFAALAKAGLKLNPAKCAFARETVTCLGHKLSREGISPDPTNTDKIRTWKSPKNVKQLRTFLGLTGYYRQFVKGYSEIANCLTDLTRDGAKWEWSDVHQKAFDTLRDTLISEQIMCYPIFTLPFIVKTDASLTAIGYVLTQKLEGKERVISYGSKKLSVQQQRWATYDREFFALVSGIRANAHYLRHNTFIVVTDHRPLLAWRRIDAKKDPTGRRTRWSIELDNYDFTLIYKKGIAHADADAMSRRGDDDDEIAVDDEEFCAFLWGQWNDPPEMCFLGIDHEVEGSIVDLNADKEERKRLWRMQEADPIISNVKAFVKKRRSLPASFPNLWFKKNFHLLTIKDGILYCRDYAASINKIVLQAIIPDSMVNEILSDLHGSTRAGHLGSEKLLLMIKRYAIWPTLGNDVEEFVKTCKTCDQLREQVPRPKTPLRSIIARQVFDHVMCDLVSFEPSKGYRYVLVFKDVFSGYIRCYKLRNKTTDGVVKAFQDLICTLGPPKLLTSDNGGEFDSNDLRRACKELGVEKRTSVPYRPQSQGNVERQNRTLIKYLQHQLIDKGNTWADHLSLVEWIHNTSPYARTKMAPYLLFFGREPPRPPLAQSNDVADSGISSSSFFSKVKEQAKAMQPHTPPTAKPDDGDATVKIDGSKFYSDLRKQAVANVDEANRRADIHREKEAATYDRKVKHVPFQEGDSAWEETIRKHKLQPKWTGPVEIEKRHSHPSGIGTTYDIARPNGTTARRNYEQLRKVNAKFDEAMKTPVSPKRKGKTNELDHVAVLCFKPPSPRRPMVSPPLSPTIAQPAPALPPPMQPTPVGGSNPNIPASDAGGSPTLRQRPAAGEVAAGEVATGEVAPEPAVEEATQTNVVQDRSEATTTPSSSAEEPADNSAIQSLPAEPASVNDIGFLLDSGETGPSSLATTPQRDDSPDDSDNQSTPTTLHPPPHPLLAEERGRGRQSATSDRQVSDEGSSSPGSSPATPRYRRLAFGRGGGLPPVCKIEVEALSSNDEGDEAGFVTANSSVDATPTRQAAEHRANEVDLLAFDDIVPGYMLLTDEGSVAIRRVANVEVENPTAPSETDEPAGSTSEAEAEDQHDLQGKIRPPKRRSHSKDPEYRANLREFHRKKSAAQQRDARGRFLSRKSSESNVD